MLFEEVLIGPSLKVGVSPISKRKLEKNVAAESKQNLQGHQKKLVLFNVTFFGIAVSGVYYFLNRF